MMRFTLLLFLLVFSLQAVPVKELQELRLAKAELALGQGNQKKAMGLIKQNLNQKYFHLGSYLFLMDYYRDQKRYVKALRVARYLAKKLHNKAFINLKSLEDLELVANNTTKPNPNALVLYFRMGRLFFSMWESKIYTEEYKKKLFSMSLKYFSICYFYKFSPAETEYYLALLRREKKEYDQAILHLFEVKDLIEKNEDQEQMEAVNYLLADTLIREGYTDAGSIYLRSIQASSVKYSQIKEYASIYLDNLAQRSNYFSMAFNYGLFFHDNIHSLTNEYLANFDAYKATYRRKSGTMDQVGFDAISSISMGKYWKLKITGDFAETEAQKRDIYFTDYRDWGVRADLQYFNLLKSQLKLSYAFLGRQEKDLGNHAYKEFRRIHQIQLQYTHTLKRGLITYAIPFEIGIYPSHQNTKSYGANITYSQFRKSPWWAPSYSASATLQGEYLVGESSSIDLSGTFSNYILINDHLSYFGWARLLRKNNSNPNIGITQISLNHDLILLTSISKKLTINGGANWALTLYDNGNSIKQWIFSVKLAYLFD